MSQTGHMPGERELVCVFYWNHLVEFGKVWSVERVRDMVE